MSYVVARMQKMKSQNLGGIQKHNQREFENHSNPDIDATKSHLNYDLVNPSNVDYRENVMNIIESQKTATRAIRKDAVLVNEWIVTSDNLFFKDKSLEETEAFFKAATEFFQERYGNQNVAYAQVHLDETTPHMHLGIVPMRDGKLQAKNVFNRKELLAIQDELPSFLEKKGFELQRGESNAERKHMSVQEFKDMHARVAEMAQIEEEKENRIKSLEKEELALKRQLSTSKEYLEKENDPPKYFEEKQTVKYKGKLLEVYVVPVVEMDKINTLHRTSSVILADNERLRAENKQLKERVSVLEKAQEQMAKIFQLAQKHASKYAKGVFERAITYAKRFYEDDPSVEKEKEKTLEHVHESSEGIQDYSDWKERKRKFERSRSLER
ncbi:MobV family relaxase [Cytobacillus sp. FSL K6-0129]|uniref:MobV family relaxase n=1 Tax=Cytobacillus sp. FSL K6-0129 TaxID=2921421 RepID=UPI0030F68A4F